MYEQKITETNKALIVIAVDQSGSMSGDIISGHRKITKSEMVADVANDLIAELIERSRRHDGVHDFFDIVVVGYSGKGVQVLHGERKWASTSELDKSAIDQREYIREWTLPNGRIQFYTHISRRWIIPTATGLTPMYEAMLVIHDIVEEWCSMPENRNSFPPEIFNITDGESNDCDYDDIVEISSKIKSLSTLDGAAILFNIHVTLASSKSILFPSLDTVSKTRRRSRAIRALYNAASEMPPIFKCAFKDIKPNDNAETYKAFCLNCTAAELISVLSIGSKIIRLS